jgi:hypothetical protein
VTRDEWIASQTLLKQFGDEGGQSWLGVEDMGRAGRRLGLNEDFLADLGAAYDRLNTPDARGNLPYGTNIGGVLGGGPLPLYAGDQAQVPVNGMSRVGYDLFSNPKNLPVLQRFGITPDMLRVDPTNGYQMDQRLWKAIEPALSQVNKKQRSGLVGGISNFLDSGGGVFALGGAALGPMLGPLISGAAGLPANIGSAIVKQLLSVGRGLTADPQVSTGSRSSVPGSLGSSPFSDGGGGGMDLFDWMSDIPDLLDSGGFDIPGGMEELDSFLNGLGDEMRNPGGSLGSFFPPDIAGNLNPNILQKLLSGLGSSSGLNGLGLGGIGDAVGLGARLAPGMFALDYAKNQGNADTSPLQGLTTPPAYLADVYNKYNTEGFGDQFDLSKFNNVYGNAAQLGRAFDTSGISEVMTDAGGLGRNFDTSQFTNLSNQVGNITDPYRGSVLKDYDMRTGQARGELLNSLQQRGVMGSSFGNMDLSNFDTANEAKRGMLSGEIGLQGINAQRGLAQDVLGGQSAARGFEQAGLGLRGNMANSLLGAQTAARGFENAGMQTQLQAAQQIQQAEQARRQLAMQALQGQGGLASNFFNTQANIGGQLTNANLQNKAIQSALFGRAFDVLGRAVAPPVYGR